MPVQADAELRAILASARSIAVVGASNKPYRDSNGIADFLIRAGYRVHPVNPAYAETNGRRCVPDLASIGEPVDIVDVFRRPEAVDGVVDQAIAVHARVIWLQPGAEHPPAAARAEAAGLKVVMDRCIAVEHRRLMH